MPNLLISPNVTAVADERPSESLLVFAAIAPFYVLACGAFALGTFPGPALLVMSLAFGLQWLFKRILLPC